MIHCKTKSSSIGGIKFKPTQKESFALVFEFQALKLIGTAWIIMACGSMSKKKDQARGSKKGTRDYKGTKGSSEKC